MNRKLYVACLAAAIALALPTVGWAATAGCNTSPVSGAPGPYRIQFTVGSTAIDAANAKTLDEIASTVKARYSRVCLVGRADQQGNKQANYALSVRRAKAVKAALEKRGVSAQNITVVGRGAAFGDDLRIAGQSQADRAVDVSLR